VLVRRSFHDRARGLVTCLSGDTDNLFVCLSARDLNPDLTIVARAYEEETMAKLYRAGASHVVSPNVNGAIRMASVLLRPSVVSFLDVATRSSDFALRMEEAEITERSSLAGKTLAEARIPEKTGLIVLAVKAGNETEDFRFNPVAETRLGAGDHQDPSAADEHGRPHRAHDSEAGREPQERNRGVEGHGQTEVRIVVRRVRAPHHDDPEVNQGIGHQIGEARHVGQRLEADPQPDTSATGIRDPASSATGSTPVQMSMTST